MHSLGYTSLEDVEGNGGAAEERCEGVATKVLKVVAVRVEQLINNREGFFDDFIPLRGFHPSPLVANIGTSTMHGKEEDLNARVEVLLW